MGRYKISDLENLSGIKAHTIRIWEQRYNILVPHRTETNIRYYDDAQLRKLLNVVSLIKGGDKISRISNLDDAEMNSRVVSLVNDSDIDVQEELLINQLINAGLMYDEVLFETTYSQSVTNFGLIEAYRRIFYPMFYKLGMLWITSEVIPSQEHFISNLIKQKMLAAIDTLEYPINSLETWILFLPEGELHDLGLIIANYSLRSKGIRVIYLGENVPWENLIEVAKQVSPTHYLLFSVKHHQADLMNNYLDKMKNDFDDPKTYICCGQDLVEELQLSKNQKVLTSFREFQSLIA